MYKYDVYRYVRSKINNQPSDDEMNKPSSIKGLISKYTKRGSGLEPKSSAELDGLKDMTEKVLPTPRPDWSAYSSNPSGTSGSTSTSSTGTSGSTSTPDNRSPVDFVVGKQQSEPFDFTDSEE
uniref:Uncharacterized protein n=1 Tax=Monilinia fructicola TaxID=38448 RepID=A0A889XQ95_MONFR|nr:hypothetical protein KQ509_mgp11 [Monilinia fructicola]QRF72263.1 hypothetical protein [Monilinia fructicola]